MHFNASVNRHAKKKKKKSRASKLFVVYISVDDIGNKILVFLCTE